MLTDILHAFAQNPTAPAYDPTWRHPAVERRTGAVELIEGIHTVGHDGNGFCFDNEGPQHRALVGPVRVARALVTNGEWLEFMRAGGYADPSLWLSDGWAVVEAEGWNAPAYWQEIDGEWWTLTLAGLKPVDLDAPVCHISYYEADAFARFAGKHLPSEAEWEVAARSGDIGDAFGIVWQWTRSAYLPYPGYQAPTGRHRRIQRQVHGQPDGVARIIACDTARACPPNVPKFLLSAGAVAIYRIAPGRFPRVTGKKQQTPTRTKNARASSASRATRPSE